MEYINDLNNYHLHGDESIKYYVFDEQYNVIDSNYKDWVLFWSNNARHFLIYDKTFHDHQVRVLCVFKGYYNKFRLMVIKKDKGKIYTILRRDYNDILRDISKVVKSIGEGKFDNF